MYKLRPDRVFQTAFSRPSRCAPHPEAVFHQLQALTCLYTFYASGFYLIIIVLKSFGLQFLLFSMRFF